MIYFDNAATTLYKPPGVAEAVSVAVGSLGNAGRGAHGVSLDAARMIYGVREKLCRLFNAEDPTRIAFTSGGLLLALDPAEAEAMAAEMRNAGLSASVIGRVTEKGEHEITVR